jgi:hypothetical protein
MKNNYCTLLTGLVCCFLIMFLFGCSGIPGIPGIPGASVPSRKKMPDFSDDDNDFEISAPFNNAAKSQRNEEFSFTASNVDLMMNGTMQGFVSIPLPDETTDSAAISLVNTVKPFAMMLLSSWAKQQRHGVLIDLSKHAGSQVYRTDYLLKKSGGFAIPVVVMWDQFSAGRVTTLKAIAYGLQDVSLTCLSDNDPSAAHLINR